MGWNANVPLWLSFDLLSGFTSVYCYRRSQRGKVMDTTCTTLWSHSKVHLFLQIHLIPDNRGQWKGMVAGGRMDWLQMWSPSKRVRNVDLLAFHPCLLTGGWGDKPCYPRTRLTRGGTAVTYINMQTIYCISFLPEIIQIITELFTKTFRKIQVSPIPGEMELTSITFSFNEKNLIN